MGLFKKKEPVAPPLPPVPVISDSDLIHAERLMDQWDASMGRSDAMWNCLEAIGQRGGYQGMQAVLDQTIKGYEAGEVLQRPWRWWNEATRAANSRGRHTLAGRIFLFTHMYATQLRPQMPAGNVMETGLETPRDDTYRDIATLAIASMSTLDPSFLIHDTATGKVDVHSALRMAREASGDAADSYRAGTAAEPSPDGGQWNSL
jgi:hypothetical protein